jgi:hypothetical protein
MPRSPEPEPAGETSRGAADATRLAEVERAGRAAGRPGGAAMLCRKPDPPATQAQPAGATRPAEIAAGGAKRPGGAENGPRPARQASITAISNWRAAAIGLVAAFRNTGMPV